MAVDKLVDSTALDTSLTAIADAIRAKTGGSSQLVFPMQFVSEIGNIPSGGGSYSGTFTPASRQFTYTFYAPGCTYLACGLTGTADLTTGVAFVYAFFCYAGHYYCSRSSNSGNSAAGDANVSSNPTVTYANDTFTLNWGAQSNITKVPQVGSEYTWCAW